MNFQKFFKSATGHEPFDYQRRIACGDSGTSSRSQLIDVPTSLGKTITVVLAWLWNRVAPALTRQLSLLAESFVITENFIYEVAGQHCSMAEASAEGEDSTPMGEHPRAGSSEHGLRGGAGGPPDPPRDTRPERATRFIETTQGLLSYTQLAPLLAERVQAVESQISQGA